MEYLPDAMFYHTLSNVIGADRIKNYLFDKNFDCSNVLPCTKVDHVIFHDALVYAQRQKFKSDNHTYQKDLRSLNDSVFPIRQDKIHPLERLMLYKLYNLLNLQEQEQLPSLLETKEDDVLPFDTLKSNYQEEPPPSQNYMQLQDVEEKHLHPGVDLDSNLMSEMKTITKIDWQNDESFEICNLLPLGEEWTSLSDLVGDGKHFHCFHQTEILVYLMGNKKTLCQSVC
jgi:hypothetical protein